MKDQEYSQKPDSSRAAANDNTSKQTNFNEFVDNSPEAIEARRLQNMVDNSQETIQMLEWQDNVSNSETQQENKTGLPDDLKAAIESASGLSLDEVRVHYNSDKPAQIGAYAYADYPNIYVATGQEKYLAEEAWHLVQQMQGRVKATSKTNGVDVNKKKSLEEEAVKHGNQVSKQETDSLPQKLEQKTVQGGVAQLASLNDYIDNKKPEHDPSQLSDATIQATDEYKTWVAQFANYVLLDRYTEAEVLLACRLALREIREKNTSKKFTQQDETYLKMARKQGNVVDKAESFKNELKWHKQGAGLQHTDFGKWIVSGSPEPNKSSSILNCWELVLYSAYKAGVMDKSRITSIYTKFNTDFPKRKMGAFDNFNVLKKGSEYTYDKDNPKSPKPLKGDIVLFKDFPTHVTIATGKKVSGKVEIMSLWTQNNKKTFKTTVEDLLTDGAKSPVKFFTPNW